MMLTTIIGTPIDAEVIRNYFNSLVNCFFKILPIWESGESSLFTYIHSLQIELVGCKEFIEALRFDSQFLSLLSILQYLIDNPAIEVDIVKREVFKAISICNKMRARYATETQGVKK